MNLREVDLRGRGNSPISRQLRPVAMGKEGRLNLLVDVPT